MPQRTESRFCSDALAVAFGSLMTLCVSGYQFGRGNHTVYLLEGLRLARPELFKHDWFVTSTLQYHAMFSWITAALMRLHLLETGFLAGYVLIVVLWHIAWLRLTQRLIGEQPGGGRFTYALSVLLYYLSAAGIGLGVYQFLQDGCFLPSNVASVAMLWGLYLWIARRPVVAGIAFGAAGLFHLNYAMVGIGTWIALIGFDWVWRSSRVPSLSPSAGRGKVLIGSICALAPGLLNIGLALEMKLRESGSIPLDRFVEVYVHFRHTHHFDPLRWPIALWVSFLWPIPPAIWAWRRRSQEAAGDPAQHDALRQAARIFAMILALQAVAFIFAGVWFVSESLVQLMLWRFSIYVKLLSCIGAAYAIYDARLVNRAALRIVLLAVPLAIVAIIALILCTDFSRGQSIQIVRTALRAHLPAVGLFVAMSAVVAIASFARSITPTIGRIAGVAICVVVAVFGWNRGLLGWGMTPETVDRDYLNVCRWARDNTPVDAVFLVPPDETAFRLEAQRAIVVNFKHVPQLSGELMVWLGRLQDVLGAADVKDFPHDYSQTMRALDDRYTARPPRELLDVAGKYSARYVVVARDWGTDYQGMLIHSENGHYFVYDRGR